MNKVSNWFAYPLIILVSVIAAYAIYVSYLAYYSDLTAMYNSQGQAAWMQRSLIIQQRIGNGSATSQQ